jgi:hypothetical protein
VSILISWPAFADPHSRYVSAISYEAAASTVLGPSALKSSTAFAKYEMENSDEFTKDLAEFALANAVFAALVESHACEQNARCVLVSYYSPSHPFAFLFHPTHDFLFSFPSNPLPAYCFRFFSPNLTIHSIPPNHSHYPHSPLIST